MNLLFYLAIERIPLGVALAIEFIGPLTVALLGSRHRADFLWLALAIVGLLLLLPLRAAEQTLDPLGRRWRSGQGVLGLYMLTGKRAGALLGRRRRRWACGWGFAGAALRPRWCERGDLHPARGADHRGGRAALQRDPLLLEMFALRRLPLKSYGILTSGEPAMGALMGLLLLGNSCPGPVARDSGDHRRLHGHHLARRAPAHRAGVICRARMAAELPS